MARRSVPLLLLFSFGVLAVGIVLHRTYGVQSFGRYVCVALALAGVVVSVLGVGLRRPVVPQPRGPWDPSLAGLLLTLYVTAGAQVGWVVDIAHRGPAVQRAATLVLVAAMIATLPYWAWVVPRQGAGFDRLRAAASGPVFWSLVGSALAVKVCAICVYARPGIDVFHVLQHGPELLTVGKNPYATFIPEAFAAGKAWGNPPRSYVYPPSLLLLSWPVVRVLSDVRFGHVLSDLAAVVLIVAWARLASSRLRLTRYARLAALLWVLHPVSWAKCWTDQLILPWLLLLLLWSEQRAGSRRQAGASGFLLSLKQYMIFWAPAVLGLWWMAPRARRHWKWLLLGSLGAALPFLIWDPVALWQSLVAFHLHTPFRADGITLSAAMVTLGGSPLPRWLGLGLAMLLSLGVAGWARQRGWVAALVGGAACYLVLFFGSGYAFPNYYHFVMGLLLAGCLAAWIEMERGHRAPTTST